MFCKQNFLLHLLGGFLVFRLVFRLHICSPSFFSPKNNIQFYAFLFHRTTETKTNFWESNILWRAYHMFVGVFCSLYFSLTTNTYSKKSFSFQNFHFYFFISFSIFLSTFFLFKLTPNVLVRGGLLLEVVINC